MSDASRINPRLRREALAHRQREEHEEWDQGRRAKSKPEPRGLTRYWVDFDHGAFDVVLREGDAIKGEPRSAFESLEDPVYLASEVDAALAERDEELDELRERARTHLADVRALHAEAREKEADIAGLRAIIGAADRQKVEACLREDQARTQIAELRAAMREVYLADEPLSSSDPTEAHWDRHHAALERIAVLLRGTPEQIDHAGGLADLLDPEQPQDGEGE